MAKRKLNTYLFTLHLAGVKRVTSAMADALYEAGCDDALVGARAGSAFVDFTRQADSLDEAVATAVRQIEQAQIGAQAYRLEMDAASLVAVP